MGSKRQPAALKLVPDAAAAEPPEAVAALRDKVVSAFGEDGDRWVGQQLRDLRRARRLSLKELSEQAGLSIGLLSQIERGSSSPSLRSLQALSRALKVPARWFFNDGVVPPAAERDVVVRRGGGRHLHLTGKGIIKELVTPDLSGTLQVLLVRIAPGGSTGDDYYWHPGEEAGYVMDGSLELWVEEQRFLLEAGDSFRFASQRPHRALNPGEVETRILWVTTPPFY